MLAIRLLRRYVADIWACTLLACGLLGLLVGLALVPRTRFAAHIDQLPPQVTLQRFYRLERNADDSFRWTSPSASLAIPVNAPGAYSVSLTLGDDATSVPPRDVLIRINGRPVGTAHLGNQPRGYTFAYYLAAQEWGRHDALLVELATTRITLPGDARLLGPMVGGIGVVPLRVTWSQEAALVLSLLLALVASFLFVRVLGARTRTAAGILGALIVLAAIGVATRGDAALHLAYQPIGHPLAFAALIGVPLGLAALARRLAPTGRLDRETLRGWRAAARAVPLAAPDGRTLWRDCLVIGAILALPLAQTASGLGFYGDDWQFLRVLATTPDQSFLGLVRGLYVGDANVRQQPLQIALAAGSYALFGLHPLGHHLINGALIIATGLLCYLALREARIGRLAALAITVLYGLLPQYSTDRFWLANSAANLSMALCLLHFYAGLRVVRATPAGRWAWGALGVAALAIGGLAYMIALPLSLLALALIWRRGIGRDGRVADQRASLPGRWGLASYLGANLLAVALTVDFTLRVSPRLNRQTGLLAQSLDRVRQLFNWRYGLDDYGLNIKQAVAIGFGDLGIGLPRAAWGAATSHPEAKVALLAAILAGAITIYLARAASADLDPAGRGSWLPLIGWGLLAYGLGYAIFLGTDDVQFTETGIGNRTAIVATLGLAMAMVGAVGWLSAHLPRAAQRGAFVALVALQCACGYVVIGTLATYWVVAHEQQEAVLADIQAHNPTLPQRSTLLLQGVCPYDGPAMVFESSWDLAGALAVRYGDASVRADIVTPRLTAGDQGISSVIYHTVWARHGYGDQLLLYDYRSKATTPLTDAETARRMLGGEREWGNCPPGHEGFGNRVLPWGNP